MNKLLQIKSIKMQEQNQTDNQTKEFTAIAENQNKEQDYELAIKLYAEIIYEALQNNPNLYEFLMPKSSFKLISIDDIEIANQETKIAA